MDIHVHNVPVEETLLARADCVNNYGFGYVELSEMRFPWDDENFATKTFFHMKERIMDCRERDWIFNTFWEAARHLKTIMADTKMRFDGKTIPVYPNVDVTDRFRELEGLMDEYEIDRLNDGYGPSNPWDAPGMKISDFIGGVY